MLIDCFKKLRSQWLSEEVVLWIVFFCFSTATALLFQKLFLPMLPGLHAGYGLLNGDAIHYHQAAIKIADSIQLNGWSFSVFLPQKFGIRGNVAVLGFLYTLFGKDPSLILPVNALFHASSGLLLLMISKVLWPGKLGRLAGIITATLFVIFPSTLNWYAQVNKDGYVIAGILLLVYSWVWFLHNYKDKNSEIKILGGSILGILLILFVRPYNLIFNCVSITLIIIIFVLWLFFKKSFLTQFKLFRGVFFAWLLIVLFVIYFGIPAMGGPDSKYNLDGLGETSLQNRTQQLENEFAEWQWENTSWLLNIIDKPVELASRVRAGSIWIHYFAGSIIDRDIRPNNFIDVLKYLPRGLQIALFAPFPDGWFKNISMTKLIGVLEILCWYILIPGVFMLGRNKLTAGVAFCVIFSIVHLTIYGYTIANVGTLHRIRYPFIFLFMLMGVAGWGQFFSQNQTVIKWKENIKRLRQTVSIDTETVEAKKNEDKVEDKQGLRQKAMSGGALVAFLTLCSFLGFFLRDVLMAQKFGLGDQLDSFFIAMLIPMFIVNVFCQSFGSTVVPLYVKTEEYSRDSYGLIRHLSFWVNIILIVVCIILIVFASGFLQVLGWNFEPEKFAFTVNLFYMALPLLLFSGMVILGNSVLSANMKFAIPAWSQLMVPLMSLLSLLILGEKYGVKSVLMGMVAGQVLNLMLVEFFLRRDRLTIIPYHGRYHTDSMKESRKQFFVLVVSTLFIQASLMINQGMAASLTSGSVAAYGLGFKGVLFVIGIISAAISFVALPYFSRFIVGKNFVKANKELATLLMFVTITMIPVSVFIYLFAKPLLLMLFVGGVFKVEDANFVIKVMEMGILQLPFFASMLIIIKFETALGRNKPILISSMIGMVINIGLNYLLMQKLGVSGIALANTLSVLCAAGLLLLMLWWSGNIDSLYVISIGLSWILYLTLVLCLNYKSFAGVFVAGSALLIMAFTSLQKSYTSKIVYE